MMNFCCYQGFLLPSPCTVVVVGCCLVKFICTSASLGSMLPCTVFAGELKANVIHQFLDSSDSSTVRFPRFLSGLSKKGVLFCPQIPRSFFIIFLCFDWNCPCLKSMFKFSSKCQALDLHGLQPRTMGQLGRAENRLRHHTSYTSTEPAISWHAILERTCHCMNCMASGYHI